MSRVGPVFSHEGTKDGLRLPVARPTLAARPASVFYEVVATRDGAPDVLSSPRQLLGEAHVFSATLTNLTNGDGATGEGLTRASRGWPLDGSSPLSLGEGAKGRAVTKDGPP